MLCYAMLCCAILVCEDLPWPSGTSVPAHLLAFLVVNAYMCSLTPDISILCKFNTHYTYTTLMKLLTNTSNKVSHLTIKVYCLLASIACS